MLPFTVSSTQMPHLNNDSATNGLVEIMPLLVDTPCQTWTMAKQQENMHDNMLPLYKPDWLDMKYNW